MGLIQVLSIQEVSNLMDARRYTNVQLLFDWWKDSDQFGKWLLRMYNNIEMLIWNGVCLWLNTNGFTFGKHNGNSVTGFMLLSEGISYHIHKFSLCEWTSKSCHRTLCIDFKCIHMFDCEKAIEVNKQLNFSMNLKRVPMYSQMVEDML